MQTETIWARPVTLIAAHSSKDYKANKVGLQKCKVSLLYVVFCPVWIIQ